MYDYRYYIIYIMGLIVFGRLQFGTTTDNHTATVVHCRSCDNLLDHATFSGTEQKQYSSHYSSDNSKKKKKTQKIQKQNREKIIILERGCENVCQFHRSRVFYVSRRFTSIKLKTKLRLRYCKQIE